MRIVASIVLSTTPIDCVSCSRNARCVLVNGRSAASSITAIVSPSNSTGSTRMLFGGAAPRLDMDLGVIGRHVVQQDALLLRRRLTDQAHAELDAFGLIGALRVAGEQPQLGRFDGIAELRGLAALHLVDGALLRVDQRRQLGQQRLADGDQVALPLQHAGELGQVGLQPVLLLVAVRRRAQVVDHGVDVVFELGDLAARFDLDRARQVALGDGGRHLGDRAHLRGQVGGQQVHVAGEVLPGAGGAGHVGLPAQPALDADLARDVGDLLGKRGQRVGHVVDGLGQRRDLALGLDRQLLAQIAVGDRGDDLHDAAHLVGQVRGHDVDRVGRDLSRCRRRSGTSAWPPSLPSVPTSRATRVTSLANARS